MYGACLSLRLRPIELKAAGTSPKIPDRGIDCGESMYMLINSAG
jgi:hypothetical protein